MVLCRLFSGKRSSSFGFGIFRSVSEGIHPHVAVDLVCPLGGGEFGIFLCCCLTEVSVNLMIFKLCLDIFFLIIEIILLKLNKNRSVETLVVKVKMYYIEMCFHFFSWHLYNIG